MTPLPQITQLEKQNLCPFLDMCIIAAPSPLYVTLPFVSQVYQVQDRFVSREETPIISHSREVRSVDNLFLFDVEDDVRRFSVRLSTQNKMSGEAMT